MPPCLAQILTVIEITCSFLSGTLQNKYFIFFTETQMIKGLYIKIESMLLSISLGPTIVLCAWGTTGQNTTLEGRPQAHENAEIQDII